MVIMTNYFNFNRRGLLGSALATTAALTVGGPTSPSPRPSAPCVPARGPWPSPAARTPSGARLPRPPSRRQLDRTGDRRHLRLRYADGWRNWRSLTAIDSADRDRRRALLYVGDAEAYEFVPADGAAQVRLHAINTVDGPATGPTRDRVRGWNGLTYLSRSGWGADESLRFEPDGTEKFPTAFFDVQTLTVHHTVSANADPDPAATVRAIYFFQCVTEDFGDIGYHLLIDQAGTVYEGRYSGPDRLPVFGPRRVGPRPSMVNGAHIAGFNAGNIGVALLGDLTSTGPTAAARQALVTVLAALATVTQPEAAGHHRLREPDQRGDPDGVDDLRSPGLGADRVPREHLLPATAAVADRRRRRHGRQLQLVKSRVLSLSKDRHRTLRQQLRATCRDAARSTFARSASGIVPGGALIEQPTSTSSRS